MDAVVLAGAFLAAVVFDAVVFAGAFLAVVVLAAVVLAAVVLVAVFFAGAFLAVVVFDAVVLAGAFFAVVVVFFAVVLVAGAFFAGAFFAAAPAAPAAVLAVLVALATVSFGSFLAPETTALRSAPALNFGTVVSLALMRSPVRGLRTQRASRDPLLEGAEACDGDLLALGHLAGDRVEHRLESVRSLLAVAFEACRRGCRSADSCSQASLP